MEVHKLQLPSLNFLKFFSFSANLEAVFIPTNLIMIDVQIQWTNKCPICTKVRIYKTKQGWMRANLLKKPCKSCSNSINRGGIGIIYKDGKRYCLDCKEYKEFGEFFSSKNGDPIGVCKPCSYKRSSFYNKNIYRFSKYNIDKTEYDKLYLIQDGKCAICSDIMIRKVHIDHDHDTGIVRGLLCDLCNQGLGQFKDSIERLIKAAEYLKKFK